MRENWTESTLGEFAILNPKEKLPKGAPVTFVAMADMAENRGGVKASSVREAGGGARFRARDTLIARITPCLENGKIGLAPDWLGKDVCQGSTEFVVARERQGVSDWAYLNLLLRSESFHGHAVPLMNGTSGRQRVSADSLAGWEIIVPPLSEQRAIAEVLGAFDALIETNRRLSIDLDGIAGAVLESVATVTELGEFALQLKVKGAQPKGTVDHFSLPAFDMGQLPETVDAEEIKSNKLKLSGPAVLVSRLNPRIPRNWMVYPSKRDAVASTEFVVLDGRGCATELVYAATMTNNFISGMNERASGTTGSHQRVDKSGVVQIQVPDARELDASQSAAIVQSVRAAHELRLENQELTRARDMLLPLLLSGKITPNSAARLLEGVTH